MELFEGGEYAVDYGVVGEVGALFERGGVRDITLWGYDEVYDDDAAQAGASGFQVASLESLVALFDAGDDRGLG
jgi:hypothetical protein